MTLNQVPLAMAVPDVVLTVEVGSDSRTDDTFHRDWVERGRVQCSLRR